MAVTAIVYNDNPVKEARELTYRWINNKHIASSAWIDFVRTYIQGTLVELLNDNSYGVLLICAKDLVRNQSDDLSFEIMAVLTKFLLNSPQPIGIILYGDHDSIHKLSNLCPNFMNIFIGEIKEPETS